VVLQLSLRWTRLGYDHSEIAVMCRRLEEVFHCS
jgi:hypothetical protein